MARNGSGVYSKVNTFVSGNPITASGHNQNWDDIATEMTNSVAADGQTSMTGALKASNGTVGAPSFTFASDTNSGIYRIGADEIGIGVNGAKVLDIATTGLTVTGTLSSSGNISTSAGVFLSPDGAAGTPGISFTSDPDSGIYHIAANEIGVAVNGAKVLDISTTGLAITGTLTATGGLGANSVVTASITNANVTYAKIQNVTNGKVLGNYSGSAAAPSEYSPNQIIPRLHVQETQTQNTASANAPSSGAWRTVVLNTTVVNEITGASLSSNVTTLPAGTYRARASYSLNYGNLGNAQLRLQNTADSTVLATGLPLSGTSGQNFESGAPLTLEGSFTLAASKTIELQIQVSTSVSGKPAVNFGPEVYVNLIFEKVA